MTSGTGETTGISTWRDPRWARRGAGVGRSGADPGGPGAGRRAGTAARAHVVDRLPPAPPRERGRLAEVGRDRLGAGAGPGRRAGRLGAGARAGATGGRAGTPAPTAPGRRPD